MEQTLKQRLARIARDGRVEWIGLRTERQGRIDAVGRVFAKAGAGLRYDETSDAGDRYRGASGTRGATLIQAEHLPMIASCSGHAEIDPALLRRNLLVSGINLLALKGRRFRVGEALLEFTELCHPCSRMEDALGFGGYSAMRGHGGISARIVESGWIAVGDAVKAVSEPESVEDE
jgi:MOSC domain-containing protein YiiM